MTRYESAKPMSQPFSDQTAQMRVVLSPSLGQPQLPAGVLAEGLADWRASLAQAGPPTATTTGKTAAPVLTGAPLLCLCLDAEDAAAVAADGPLSAVLAGAEVPVLTATPDTVTQVLLGAALAHATATTRAAADLRAALAEVRGHHMQMQTDHAELEAWVYEALAPKHKLARSWPDTGRSKELGAAPLCQPLPVPARGFLAVDVHLAASAPQAGRLTLTLGRLSGPDLAEPVSVHVPQGRAGWLRLSLPAAPGGAPEDAVLRLAYAADQDTGTIALSLGPDSPFADLNLTTAAGPGTSPLALRVYQTLSRQPAPPMHAPGAPLPADGQTRLVRPGDLGTPLMLPYFSTKVRRALRTYPDIALVEYWQDEDAIFVHPSIHRPVVAVVPGLEVEALVQARSVIQLSRHDTLSVAFAMGVVPAASVTSGEAALAHLGPWTHLLPAEWGETWVEPATPLTGQVDLLLATAMPGMPFNRHADALFHAFRMTSATGTGPAQA